MFLTAFIATFVVLGIPFGVMAYLASHDIRNKLHHFGLAWGIGLVSVLVLSGIFCLSYNADAKEWNDGYCVKCEEPLRFSSASNYKGTTYYYWTCDNCGSIIELTHNFTK